MSILYRKYIFANVPPSFNSVLGLLSANRPYERKFTSTTSMSQPPPCPSLREVPPEEYQQFADALREFHPHSYQVEAMLRGHLEYDYLGLLRASLYAPAASAHRHHLAIISPSASTRERCMFTIYWNDRHLSDDDVCQLLQSLPIDGWQQPIMIRQMPMHLRPKMDAILLRLSGGDLHLFAPIPVHVYSLAPEDTPSVPQLPEGYYFGSLNGSHGGEVLQRWVERATETPECFAKYLDTLPSAAVFHTADLTGALESDERNVKPADELVSYAVYKPGSDVGMTYTKEEHRRRGLAQAATLQLAHRLHGHGLPVMCLVDVGYDASVQLHESMGFRRFTEAAFPFYFPKQFNFSTLTHFSHFKTCFPESIKRWEQIWKVE